MGVFSSKNDTVYNKPLPAEPQTTDHVDTVVGASVVVEGDFASQGNIIVKGVVSGSVKTAQHLLVEEGAKIMANVKAGSARIAGEVRGNVKVKEELTLTSSAKVVGDVECGTLVVEAGAGMSGRCHTVAVDFSSLKETMKNDKNSIAQRRKKRSDDDEDMEMHNVAMPIEAFEQTGV